MGMIQSEYVDDEGRKWARLIPEGAPKREARRGVALGPPSLASLHLPLSLEVRLHNQLYDRGILDEREAKRRIREVTAAVQAAAKVDAQRVLAVYSEAAILSASAADD